MGNKHSLSLTHPMQGDIGPLGCLPTGGYELQMKCPCLAYGHKGRSVPLLVWWCWRKPEHPEETYVNTRR